MATSTGNPASADDVVARWRSLGPDETRNAETFLDDAWREVRRRVPGIAERIELEEAGRSGNDHSDLYAEAVRILVAAVLPVLKNPDGTLREGVDNSTWEPNQAAASGLLVIRDADLAPLQPAAPGQLGGMYVIGLGG